MAQPTVTAPIPAWERVAAKVRARRLALGGRSVDEVIDVAEARYGSTVSRTVVSLVENARQETYAIRSLRVLSTGLDWAPDSIERILAGAAP